MKNITIWHRGNAISIQQDFADLHNIKHGHQIQTEAEFWHILNGHAAHMILKLNLMIEAKKQVN